MEKNVILSRSASKSALENKKLTKSSTASQLKQTGSENISHQPVIKESVLVQPRKTLSKCKAKIDLKSTLLPTQEKTLSKSKTSVKLSTLQLENNAGLSTSRVLPKSKTSMKLTPLVPASQEISAKSTQISDANSAIFSLPRTRSRTSMKFAAAPLIVTEINIDDPPAVAPKPSLSKYKTSVKLPCENIEKPRSQTLSKSKTSVKLNSANNENCNEVNHIDSTLKPTKKLSSETAKNKRRSTGKLRRSSARLEPVLNIVDLDINTKSCDIISTNDSTSKTECNKLSNVPATVTTTVPPTPAPSTGIKICLI